MGTLLDLASLVVVPSGYKEDVVYSVKPTDGSGDLDFTRSNDTATRVNSAGLIEKVRTNLVLYSEQFDNAAWTKNRSSITANALVNPVNGATTADYIVEDTANGTHEVIQILTVTSGIGYTLSTYAKADTRTKIALILAGSAFSASGGNGQAIFNLSTGVVVSAINGATASITSVGNGWYRCSVTKLTSDTNGIPVISLVDASDNVSYTGNGTSRAAIFGAQFEVSDFGATDYIPTTSAAVSVGMTANVPRLDYSGGGCPKLLLEPQRTNLATYSEQANQYTLAAATIGSNVAISPDGYENADSLIEDGNTGSHAFYSFGLTTFAAAPYTASVFAKKGSRDWFAFQIYHGANHLAYFNLNTGIIGTITSGATATITNYGNGWYRCTITATTTANIGGIAIYSANADNSISFTGTNGLTAAYFYGWQLEAGSYATSYIPTLGAAVTRGADACFKTGVSSLIGQTEGTLFAEINVNRTGGDQNIELGDGTSANRINLRLNLNNNYQLIIVQGGVVVFNQTSASTFTQGQTIKLAAVYKSGDVTKLFVNGVSVLSATAGTITGSLSAIFTYLAGAGLAYMNSPVNGLILFPTPLTDTQAIELTTL